MTAMSNWRDGVARKTIVDFVEETVSEGVPVEERVAVFDNDGTLWCEKPMPIQLDFILRRFVEMAEAKPELRTRQPWKSAYERDYGWYAAVMAEHYAGNDTNVQTLAAGGTGGVPGDQCRGLRGEVRRFPALRTTSDTRSWLPRNRVRADGRAARLPGAQRLHQLHRLRWRS